MAMLLAAPAAQAAQPVRVSGEVAFGPAPILSGEALFTSAEGILDLAPAIAAGEPLVLSWASARGYERHKGWTRVDTPLDPANVGDPAELSRNVSLSYEAGGLRDLVCGPSCRVALVALGEDQTRLSLAGRAEGALRRLEVPHLSWAELSKPHPNGFFHEVPAGSPALGGNGTTVHGSLPGVSGRVGLLLVDAAATVEAGAERTRLDVLVKRAPPPGGRDETAFLYLVLEGAHLSAPTGSVARLLAPSPALSLQGYLGDLSATGAIQVDGRTERLEKDALQLEGNLTLLLAGGHAVQTLPAGLEGETPLRAALEGEATSVRIEGRAVASAPAVSRAAVATGLTLAALLAAAWLLLPRLVLTPLYSRIKASQVLSHPARQALYDLIGQTPGLTPTELGRRLGAARVVVQHHLRMLETHQLVTMRRTGRRRAYFLTGAVPGGGLVEGHATLQDETRRRLAAVLLAAPRPLTQADLSEMTGLSQRLVSYHLSRLAAQGLVVAEGALPRRYRPTPLLGAALAPAAPDPSVGGAAG